MTVTTTASDLVTPNIDITRNPITGITNIEDVRAMPEDTKEEKAAKWIACKTIESAGDTAKSIRSRLGEELSTVDGMQKDDLIEVNGQTWKYATRNGSTSGVTIGMLNAFKDKYSKVSWIAPAIDNLIAEAKTSYVSKSLKLG